MRLGLHVSMLTDGSKQDQLAREYIRQVKPPVVKVMKDAMSPSFLDFCIKEGCRIVGRNDAVIQEHQNANDPNIYRRHIQSTVALAQERPEITWWEFYNEWNVLGDELRQYGRACIEFMQAMEQIDRKAAIGCFATGNPNRDEPEVWDPFEDAVRHACAHGHAIALHEYSAPDMRMQCGGNRATPAGLELGDPCTAPDVQGSLTLRYRRLLASCSRWGVRPEILITESGNDDVMPDLIRPHFGNKKRRGFREWRQFENRLLGDYADQMRWYCEQLGHTPEVIGVVDYGYAAREVDKKDKGGSLDWSSFDLAREAAFVRQRMIPLQASIMPRGGEPIIRDDTGFSPSSWQVGDWLISLVALPLRQAPGKAAPTVDGVDKLPKGWPVRITGAAQIVDQLPWWPLACLAPDGSARAGFAAEVNSSGGRVLDRL